MVNVSQKIAIVTGAAGALGGAVAHHFSEGGWSLALLDRGEGRLKIRYPEWEESKHHLFLDPVDLLDRQEVERAVEEVLGHFGRVDVLVNAAGGFKSGVPIDQVSDDDWNFMMDINARTVLNASRAVVPHMKRQSAGKLINIGARPGLKGTNKSGPYAASKSAVLRLTESLSAELKHEGINVNAVIPGTLDTPANRAMMPDADHTRWVRLDEIARVIGFLASDAAGAIHGALIPVFGTG